MIPADLLKLHDAVFQFQHQMERRLLEKAEQGYIGWDNPEMITNVELISRMHDDINSDDPAAKAIDIANRAMMLWYRKQVGR